MKSEKHMGRVWLFLGAFLRVFLLALGAGVAVGAIGYVCVGYIVGSEASSWSLAARGSREIGFLFGIWGFGGGIVAGTGKI